ncbi:hypothetical protein JCM5353_006521 [Sporobolomyces roseus]
MVYWRQRKREGAAQDLLVVVRQLSDERYISSPFTLELRLEVMGKLVKVRSDLLEQGYTPSSTTQLSLQLAINLVQPFRDHSLPYLSLLDLIKLLIDTIAALHSSSSDLENRSLPTELLVHIYEHVCDYRKPPACALEEEEEDVAATQRTLRSLSAVSHAWRQIVLSRCRGRVYIGSPEQLRLWCKSKTRYMSAIKQLHLDLSNSDLSIVDIRAVLKYVAKWSWRMKVHVNIDIQEDCSSSDFGTLCSQLAEFGGMSSWFSTLRLSVNTDDDLLESYQLLTMRTAREDCELYLGDGIHPILADRFIRSEAEWREPLSRAPWTDYRCLVAPWHVISISDFLRCTDPHHAPQHRLQHLEISLEVHQVGSPGSLDNIKEFFHRMSAKLERLAIRIRLPLTVRRLEHQRLQAFSRAFVDGLLSCPNLRRLEVGGLGFSTGLFTYLSELSLETLILLPNLAEFDDSALLNFLSPTSRLPLTLRYLQVYREPSSTVIRRYQKSEVKLRFVDRRKEEAVLEGARKEARIDPAWLI